MSARMPQCEECRKKPAISFSWFVDRARWYAPRSGTWKFTCECIADREQYYVMLRNRGLGFLASQAEREDWLRHLGEKIWFDPVDFATMLERFERARRAA